MWIQKNILLKPQARGFHIITAEVLAGITEMEPLSCGICHLFIQHTSASISINEDADPTVRIDLESYFNHSVPEGESYYLHNDEGPDDMPAHIKNALLGTSVSIPIVNGQLGLGTWQGIYLCEHRNRAGGRHLIATLNGESR